VSEPAQKPRSPDELRAADIDRLVRKFVRVLVPGFFGTVSIGVQNGRVNTINTEQHEKPEEL
jgi:hypothetical protein